MWIKLDLNQLNKLFFFFLKQDDESNNKTDFCETESIEKHILYVGPRLRLPQSSERKGLVTWSSFFLLGKALGSAVRSCPPPQMPSRPIALALAVCHGFKLVCMERVS